MNVTKMIRRPKQKHAYSDFPGLWLEFGDSDWDHLNNLNHRNVEFRNKYKKNFKYGPDVLSSACNENGAHNGALWYTTF